MKYDYMYYGVYDITYCGFILRFVVDYYIEWNLKYWAWLSKYEKLYLLMI